MQRRIATYLALAALAAAPLAGRAHEWEEDYSGDSTDEAPADDYRVDVDVGAPAASVDLETFQGALSPYGAWVDVGGYGRVWQPRVAAGWRPYYYGRWEWTNEGWLWVSDEPFGWAAYHYGRWAYEPYHGWIWVPGTQWAPAWVSWRYSGDVVGWAPLAPGVSVYVSATPFFDTWTFVPCNRFVAEPVYRVAYGHQLARHYFDVTVPAPARPGARPMPGRPVVAPAWGGPPPRAIEQRIGRPVTPVRVVAAPSPGPARVGPNEVSVYRPELRTGRPPAQGLAPRPEARGFQGQPGGARPPAAGIDRPSFRPGPAPAAPQPGTSSTPAPAARGDAGRFAPRTGSGQQAPGGSGASAGRAWTPPAAAPTPVRPEFHGGGQAPARPSMNGGGPAPVRPELHGLGRPAPVQQAAPAARNLGRAAPAPVRNGLQRGER